MRFAIVELRKSGIRLSRDELAVAPAACGELLVKDWLKGNAEGRALSYAEVLYTRATYPFGLMAPLFEPRLIRMRENWFVLSGWQIEVAPGGEKVEYRQDWIVRPSTEELEAAQEVRLAERASLVKLHGAKAM